MNVVDATTNKPRSLLTDADGNLKIAGTFSADPPEGAATDAKLDEVITAIEGISVPAPEGGSTEAKQDDQLTALANLAAQLSADMATLIAAVEAGGGGGGGGGGNVVTQGVYADLPNPGDTGGADNDMYFVTDAKVLLVSDGSQWNTLSRDVVFSSKVTSDAGAIAGALEEVPDSNQSFVKGPGSYKMVCKVRVNQVTTPGADVAIFASSSTLGNMASFTFKSSDDGSAGAECYAEYILPDDVFLQGNSYSVSWKFCAADGTGDAALIGTDISQLKSGFTAVEPA